MKDLLKEFDIWYWNQPNKNRENTSNKKGYQHILNYLNKLGGNKLLNLKNVRELAETYPHGSKSQMEIAKQFFRLAKFADIQELKKFGEYRIIGKSRPSLDIPEKIDYFSKYKLKEIKYKNLPKKFTLLHLDEKWFEGYHYNDFDYMGLNSKNINYFLSFLLKKFKKQIKPRV